jgi:iron complex outermembrane receptor protein
MIATSPGVRQYVNIDKATLVGFELTWSQQIGKYFSNEFTSFYTKGHNPAKDQPLPEINPFEIKNKFQGRFDENKLSPYVLCRHAFRQDRVSEDFGERKTKAFTVVDLGMRLVMLKNTQLTLAAQNIFDVSYREHLSRYIRPTLPLSSPGRSFVVMASWEF